MSLREPKPLDPTKPKLFRIPESLQKYLKESAVGSRTQTDVVLEAVALDRDLGRLLAPHRARLAVFAQSMGLDLDHGLARVVAELVVRGLDVYERDKKSPKK